MSAFHSYTQKSNTRYGVNDSNGTYNPDTIKCGFASSTDLLNACNNDPSCVAYVDHSLSNKRCTLQDINTDNSKETTESGYTAYIKDYSNCKTATGEYGSLNAPGYCISDKRVENVDAKNKLIKSLESKKPLTLIIARNGAGKIAYVAYMPIAPTFSTANLPYNSTTFNITTLNIYFILTIDVEDTYRFIAGDSTNQNAFKYYVNGVPLDINTAKLAPGDYLICLEINTIAAKTYINNISVVTNSTATTKTLDKLVIKPINFYTQVGDKYTETLNNVCTPDNYLTSEYCKGLIKDSITANDSVKNRCLVSSNGSYVYTGTEVCSNIIDAALNKTGEINAGLSADLYNAVSTWFSGKISLSSNLSAMTPVELSKISYMFDRLKAYSGTIPGIQTQATRAELAKYCTTSSGDVFSVPNDNTLCGKVYNDPALVTYNNMSLSSNKALAAEIDKSKEDLKYAYCTKLNADGTYRYENDPKCKEEYKTNTFLNTDIKQRCVANNKWNSADKYCNKLSEEIANGDISSPAVTVVNPGLKSYIKDFKNLAVLTDISNIENLKKNNGKLEFEDYILNYYSKLPDRDTNALFNEDYLYYCQTTDPNLNNGSSCAPFYKTFKDSKRILSSRARMRNSNCSKDELLTTDLDTQDAIDKNINKCKTLATNGNLDNLITFKDTMTKYCSSEKNIATEDCKNYYNTIGNKLVNAMSTPGKASAFGNKSNFDEPSIEPEEGSSVWGTILFLILILVVCVSVFFIGKQIVLKSKDINRTSANQKNNK